MKENSRKGKMKKEGGNELRVRKTRKDRKGSYNM